jgi:2-iminobutanoate/2-iminopropanoate deaminase
MKKSIIKTDKAPSAIGPYEQGILMGDFLFTSGQIALDPATGQMVQGEVELETERVLNNIEAILKAAGMSMNNVLKTTVYMTDLAQFTRMNQVYEKFFSENKPARATVQVAGLPKGAKVEIDVVAHR